jgi:hypothetical protein
VTCTDAFAIEASAKSTFRRAFRPTALLDRSWGKAVQPHTREEGGDIIRQIIERGDEN